MSRLREFDVNEVLTKATEVFWQRGYEATSVHGLEKHLGISRSSLYAAFGGKRALFLRALRNYNRIFREEAFAGIARSAASPRQAIADIFRAASAAVLEDGSRNGCLLVNTALELAPHDREIGEIVRNAFTEMEDFLRTLIEWGQARGEIPADVSAADAARGLLGLFLGLCVLARSRPDEALLRSIENRADALLG